MSHQLASDQSQPASRTGILGTAGTKTVPILPALTPRKLYNVQVSSPSREHPTRRRQPQEPTKLYFVNLTGQADELDSKSRKSINIHVQRDYSQKKRWEKINRLWGNREKSPTQCRCDRPSKASSTARQHVLICPTCKGQVSHDGGQRGFINGRQLPLIQNRDSRGGERPGVLTRLGQGRVDPFHSYPIDVQSDTHMLLDFFIQYIVPHHLSFGEVKNSPFLTILIPLTIADSAPFHGVLLNAASYMYGLTGQIRYAEMSLYHQGAAIQAINSSLSNPSKAVTDANIIAVCFMTAFELANGDRAALEAHFKGLERMINLRGGIQNPDLAFIRTQVLWSDRTSATLLGTKPYFSSLQTSYPSSPNDKHTMAPESIKNVGDSLSEGFKILVEKGYSCLEVLKALDEMCEKIAILSSTNDSKIWMDHIGPFSEERVSFEYLLLEVPETPITAMSDCEAIGECCRFAALSFAEGLMGPRPDGLSGILWSLGNQIQIRLKQMNIPRCLEEFDEILLWILFLGGYGLSGSGRAWFATLLPTVYNHLAIETWEGCVVVLEKFLWLNNFYADQCQSLWLMSRET